MINDDLSDWSAEIDKRIHCAKIQNEKSYKACKQCGDVGTVLLKKESNGMYYLCVNYCDCASGVNLREILEKNIIEKKKNKINNLGKGTNETK